MHIIPNGQNMQFLVPTKIIPAPPPQTEETHEAKEHLEFAAPPPAKAPPAMKLLPKDVAPGLNRKQRKMELARLKYEAKSRTAVAAEREMKRQKKESKNG